MSADKDDKEGESELQTIPARHGTATFVPAGQTIKIINTSGTQVIDTWAFALPSPPSKRESSEERSGEQEQKQPIKEKKKEESSTVVKQSASERESDQATKDNQASDAKFAPQSTTKKIRKHDTGLPSQEEAERATRDGLNQGEGEIADAGGNTDGVPQQKNTWSSYVPSIGWSSSKKKPSSEQEKKDKEEQAKNSRTWASYFPSGKGFSSYVPESASKSISAFAATHERDPNKTYLQQLQDFSKTPVGAAGFSMLTGSGYSSGLYAGYQAWNQSGGPGQPPMEYMSMPHSRAMMLHMTPKEGDVLVSNLREPMLTLIEDSSPGIHDTLMAACDPQRYKGLGVENWEEHGSCAENLAMSLKEINARAGLKGIKAIGADVTVHAVPAPLNLFMNIPWDNNGNISFEAPKCKSGDYVRFRAERDVVICMSACPQDILKINNQDPTDAHFIVEQEAEADKGSKPRKKPAPKRASSSQISNGASTPSPAPGKKKVPIRRSSGQPRPKVNGGEAASETSSAPKRRVPAKLAPKQKEDKSSVNGNDTSATEKISTSAAKPTASEVGSSSATPKKKPRKLASRAKPDATNAPAS